MVAPADVPQPALATFPVVCKYGGSSLRTLRRVRRVARAIARRHRAGEAVVVVCSAMGGTTDALLRRARALHPEAAPRELDMLVTCGERAAVALLAIALGAQGVPVRSLTGSQAGIVTDEVHQNARIVAVRPHRVAAGLADNHVVVVAGYQGVSRTHEVTTLGRGGSDATAVALGAALGAREVALYSDVDGVYAADPRALADAAHLPEVDYATLHALGLAGARVVCAEATRLAEALGVELWARPAHVARRQNARQTRIGPPPAAGARTSSVRPVAHAVATTPATLVRLAGLPAVARLEQAARGVAELRAGAGGVALFVAAEPARTPTLSAYLADRLDVATNEAPPSAGRATCADVVLVSAVGPGAGALPLAPLLTHLAAAEVRGLHLQRGPRLLQLAVAPDDEAAALRAVDAALQRAVLDA